MLRELRESAVPSISAVSTLSAAARTPLGAVVENQTAVELARDGRDLFGWKRTPAGAEIDFVVKRDGAAVPVECKAALTVNRKHMRGIVDYLWRHAAATGFLVSLAPGSTTVINGFEVVNLPAYRVERLGADHRPQAAGGGL